MQLLLLTVALTLSFLVQADEWPVMIPAPADKILGKWYIHYWVGNMPIPENIKASPLPPFIFVRNTIGQLEFRMNISKPIGCIVFKQVLDYNEKYHGSYYAWSRHYFQIYLLEREDFSVIQYQDNLREFNHNMMMLVDTQTWAETPTTGHWAHLPIVPKDCKGDSAAQNYVSLVYNPPPSATSDITLGPEPAKDTGRSRVKDPRFLKQFETFTAFVELNVTDIIKPSYDDSCELSRES